MSNSVSEIASVLFSAMRIIYTTGLTKDVTSMPGSEITRIHVENFVVTERYDKTPGLNEVYGLIEVLSENVVLWNMEYSGEYDPRVIHFLRLALAEGFLYPPSKDKPFLGCRGPKNYPAKGVSFEQLTYENKVESGSTFLKFSGEESIISPDQNGAERYGGYKYRGGLFVAETALSNM